MNTEERLFLKLKHRIDIEQNAEGRKTLQHKNLPRDFFIWAGYAYVDEEDGRAYIQRSFRHRLAIEDSVALENEILEKIYEYNSRPTDVC